MRFSSHTGGFIFVEKSHFRVKVGVEKSHFLAKWYCLPFPRQVHGKAFGADRSSVCAAGDVSEKNGIVYLPIYMACVM